MYQVQIVYVCINSRVCNKCEIINALVVGAYSTLKILW